MQNVSRNNQVLCNRSASRWHDGSQVRNALDVQPLPPEEYPKMDKTTLKTCRKKCGHEFELK